MVLTLAQNIHLVVKKALKAKNLPNIPGKFCTEISITLKPARTVIIGKKSVLDIVKPTL